MSNGPILIDESSGNPVLNEAALVRAQGVEYRSRWLAAEALLARALPILADYAGRDPAVAKLCEEIRGRG